MSGAPAYTPSLSRVVLTAIAALALVSAHGSAQSGAPVAIQAVEGWRIGGLEATGPYAFEYNPRIAIGPSSSVYAVTDRVSISVFDSAGVFQRRIGREGGGPGEFRSIAHHGFIGDTLWVIDRRMARVTWLDSEGGVIRTGSARSTGSRQYPNESPVILSAIMRNGWAVVEPNPALKPRPGPLDAPIQTPALVGHIASDKWDIVATVPTPRALVIPRVGYFLFPSIPLAPILAVAPKGNGLAVLTWNDSVPGATTVVRFGQDGNAMWGRRLKLKPIFVSSVARDSIIREEAASVERMLRRRRSRGEWAPHSAEAVVRENLYMPDYYPAFGDILVGIDGTIWLRRLNDQGLNMWWVLDPAGDLLMRTRLPFGFQLKQASRHSVWGTEVGEYDTVEIVKLNLREGP